MPFARCQTSGLMFRAAICAASLTSGRTTCRSATHTSVTGLAVRNSCSRGLWIGPRAY